jgi:hypothetical protein
LKKLEGIVGGIMIFDGLASIPFIYGFVSASNNPFLSFLMILLGSMMPIGIGLFLLYNTLRFKKSAVEKKDNILPGNIPAPTPNMPRRIEIIINDTGVALSTEGLSPQEIIASLELTKHYVVTKHVGIGSPMDVVRRK